MIKLGQQRDRQLQGAFSDAVGLAFDTRTFLADHSVTRQLTLAPRASENLLDTYPRLSERVLLLCAFVLKPSRFYRVGLMLGVNLA